MPDTVPREQAREGTRLALHNAKCWLKDAEILLNNSGHPGHAVALVLNALEEFAKSYCLGATILEPQRHFQGQLRELVKGHHDFRLAFGYGLCISARFNNEVIKAGQEQLELCQEKLGQLFEEQGAFDFFRNALGNYESAMQESGLSDVMVSVAEGLAEKYQSVVLTDNPVDILLRLREMSIYSDWSDDANGFTGPECLGTADAEALYSFVRDGIEMFEESITNNINSSCEDLKHRMMGFRWARKTLGGWF